jgi:hypothetical protein
MRITVLAIGSLLLAACADQPVAPTTQSGSPSFQASNGGIVHRVSIGGPDVCAAFGARPGCDGNYSLIAMEMADGNVRGNLEDVLGSGAGGVGVTPMHGSITCLEVATVTNQLGTFHQAWIGGVATQPADIAGHPFITFARDRGTSANDLLDWVGFTQIDPANANCHDQPPVPFRPVPQGQVKIW